MQVVRKQRLKLSGLEGAYVRKGDICEGYVEKIDFPNKGYVWVDEDGMKTRVIVKNAVPGQKLRF